MRMRKFYQNIPTIMNGHQEEFLAIFFRLDDNAIGSLGRAIMKIQGADRYDILESFLPTLGIYGLNARQGKWFLDWVFDARYENVDD
jgi:hypothetical protein